MLFDPMTRESIKTMSAGSVPDDKKNGAVLFYNQISGQMEIYVPWNEAYYTLGGNQITENGEVGTGELTGMTSGVAFVETLKTGLASLGAVITEGVDGFKNLVIDTITTKKVKMEKMEMVDQETGEVYCMWLANGEWQKIKGDCELSTTAVAQIGEESSPTTAVEVNQQELIEETIEQAANEAASTAAQQAVVKITTSTTEKIQNTVTQTVQQEVQQQLQAAAEAEALAKILNIVSVPLISDINVGFGTSLESVGLPEAVSATLSNDSTQDLTITWDGGNPTYDSNTANTYIFSGALTLPENVTNTNNITASVNVIVAENKPTAGDLIESAASALTLPIWNYVKDFYGNMFNTVVTLDLFIKAKAELINPINEILKLTGRLFNK
jgi:hypothetical protein